MRIQKSDVIGGLPADVARVLIRRYAGHESTLRAATLLLADYGYDDSADFLEKLATEGFLESRQRGEQLFWRTTIKGNALAMASFGKPISRATAARVLGELIERSRAMNSDPTQLLFVHRLRVFGSYLQSDVQELGDVDVELTLGRRVLMKDLAAYGAKSDRRFNTYMDQLFWAQREFVQKLRNRSQALSISLQNVTGLTNSIEVVYLIADDPNAIMPPAADADGSVILAS